MQGGCRVFIFRKILSPAVTQTSFHRNELDDVGVSWLVINYPENQISNSTKAYIEFGQNYIEKKKVDLAERRALKRNRRSSVKCSPSLLAVLAQTRPRLPGLPNYTQHPTPVWLPSRAPTSILRTLILKNLTEGSSL